MTSPSLPTPARRPPAESLPAWDQLPRERRHELTAVLAAMILKQLPAGERTPGEVGDEQP